MLDDYVAPSVTIMVILERSDVVSDLRTVKS